MKTILEIENLKCMDCEKSLRCNYSITKSLSQTRSITNIHIDETNKIVSFNLLNVNKLPQIIQTLKSMGYVQKGEGNIIHKIIYLVLCTIGKFSK